MSSGSLAQLQKRERQTGGAGRLGKLQPLSLTRVVWPVTLSRWPLTYCGVSNQGHCRCSSQWAVASCNVRGRMFSKEGPIAAKTSEKIKKSYRLMTK